MHLSLKINRFRGLAEKTFCFSLKSWSVGRGTRDLALYFKVNFKLNESLFFEILRKKVPCGLDSLFTNFR